MKFGRVQFNFNQARVFFCVNPQVRISAIKEDRIRMWLDPPGGGCNIPTYLTTMLLLAVLALTNGESTSRKKKIKREREKNNINIAT